MRDHATTPTGERNDRHDLELFETAVATITPDDPYIDRAMLHHSYGQMLSARGDRRRAINHLRSARDLLAAVGAQPFAERVDADLAHVGVRRRELRDLKLPA
jgi:hypothetical protein